MSQRLFQRAGHLTLCLILAATLAACGGNSRAPVEDRYPRSTAQPPVHAQSSQSTYRVQRGDTLYSIAFRYGLDFRRVAAANNIPAPYTIYVGQTLVLREGSLPVASAPTAQRETPVPAKAPAKSPTKSPTTARTGKPPPASTPPAKTYSGAKVSTWRWPTAGPITRGYSSSVHKGIDIGGKRGDPVYAVAPGKVVYAGTGIVGFGELLIVKHNDVYLSAYGHNDKLLAREGQVVAAGEKIAEKGSSGTDMVKLHFEIRKEGKPVDPQRLLPRR